MLCFECIGVLVHGSTGVYQVYTVVSLVRWSNTRAHPPGVSPVTPVTPATPVHVTPRGFLHSRKRCRRVYCGACLCVSFIYSGRCCLYVSCQFVPFLTPLLYGLCVMLRLALTSVLYGLCLLVRLAGTCPRSAVSAKRHLFLRFTAWASCRSRSAGWRQSTARCTSSDGS